MEQNVNIQAQRKINIKAIVTKKTKIPVLEREKKMPIPNRIEINPKSMDFCRCSWLNINIFSFIETAFFTIKKLVGTLIIVIGIFTISYS